jgi:3-hydroxybutyryl-CoA dehydrogenase
VGEIQRIAVIGAATPGASIAQFAAAAGFYTILEDILPASLRRAEAEIRLAFERSIACGASTRPAADAALARIEYASSVEHAARAADLVIEAVPDELESKIEILTLLDKVSRPATIFALSSPSFSVAELAGVTYRAEKILGMRFSLPLEKAELLEIVRTRETTDETVAACTEAGLRMSRKVVVREEPPHLPVAR